MKSVLYIRLRILNALIVALLVSVSAADDERHQSVLELRPAGYWPADEGEGVVLHDRSGNGNDGAINHVPWRDGMLDFTSAFQWGEVPFSDAWQGDGLSIGGWLFTRDREYNRNGMLFMAVANPIRLWVEPSIILRVREGMELEVVSNGGEDAIGSLADKDTVAAGSWQHVLYTWQDGNARLFLDGKQVQSADNVPFELGAHPLIIGSDADWWMLHPPGSNSLNGSVRDLVLFNRALAAEEVTQLEATTRPAKRPWTVTAEEFAIDRDGEHNDVLPLAEFLDASVQTRYAALQRMKWLRDRGKLETSAALCDTLVQSLDQWPLRSLAAELLLSCRPQGPDALKERLPRWMEMVAAANVSDEERGTAALALATMKADAGAAIPVLVERLQEITARDEAHPPRVEELLRNALIQAMLAIAPQDEDVRAAVGQAVAKPILDLVDLSLPGLEDVRALVAKGRYTDAFFAFASLQPTDHGERYFSQGDVNRDTRAWHPNRRAYTPSATRQGVTYTLGAGESFDGVEAIPPAEFENRVTTIAKTFPEAARWRQPDFPHLYRVKITKTMPDGAQQTAYLAGEDFIFDGTDGKVRGWSIAIDSAGYLHIVGGQHNAPNPDAYIPGSWEKLGLSRDRQSESFPNQMYFVSKRAGDITQFDFVGRRDNPRNIPAGYLNYMNWVQDNAGELFLYGRINVFGWQSWGLYHYQVANRRWVPLGGNAGDVIADALAAHPDWEAYLHRNLRGGLRAEPGPKSVVWAWQPNFYNYCRDSWGIKFDKTNRLHLRMAIRGLDENGRIVDSQVYAWSDDLGQTFHRADGSPVALPLTVNPAPNHNADADSCRQRIGWDLYCSLLTRAGF